MERVTAAEPLPAAAAAGPLFLLLPNLPLTSPLLSLPLPLSLPFLDLPLAMKPISMGTAWQAAIA